MAAQDDGVIKTSKIITAVIMTGAISLSIFLGSFVWGVNERMIYVEKDLPHLSSQISVMSTKIYRDNRDSLADIKDIQQKLVRLEMRMEHHHSGMSKQRPPPGRVSAGPLKVSDMPYPQQPPKPKKQRPDILTCNKGENNDC